MENNNLYLPLNQSEIERKEKCQNCTTLTFCYITGLIIVSSIIISLAFLMGYILYL